MIDRDNFQISVYQSRTVCWVLNSWNSPDSMFSISWSFYLHYDLAKITIITRHNHNILSPYIIHVVYSIVTRNFWLLQRMNKFIGWYFEDSGFKLLLDVLLHHLWYSRTSLLHPHSCLSCGISSLLYLPLAETQNLTLKDQEIHVT